MKSRNTCSYCLLRFHRSLPLSLARARALRNTGDNEQRWQPQLAHLHLLLSASEAEAINGSPEALSSLFFFSIFCGPKLAHLRLMVGLSLLSPQVWIKKMGTLGLWTVSAAALFLLICCNCVPDSSTISSTSPLGFKAELSNRKLKGIVSTTINMAIIGGDSNGYNLDDYPGHDPSPSSKVDVHAGPIENGSPFMPYFTRPTPPPHPLHAFP